MTENFSYFTIKIKGSAAPTPFMKDVSEIVVDLTTQLPSMFTIVLRDHEFKHVDGTEIGIGDAVEISASAARVIGGGSGTLFKGEVTSIEPHFSGGGDTTLVIRGYDKSHRLHRGRQTRTFLSQADSRILDEVAGESGLTVSIDSESTSIEYEYVLQNNQTNWEFLEERARRIGHQILVDNAGTLHLKAGTATLGDGPKVTLGDDLLSFRPCWSAAHQTGAMEALGWDPLAKQAVSGEQQASGSFNQGGMTQAGGSTADGKFGAATAVVTESILTTTDEATAVAKSLSYDISRDFVQAEGVCLGNPAILAGWTVDVQGVGGKFSGKYFVTAATHVWKENGVYETRFSISGRYPNTLSHLLDSGNGNSRKQGLTYGVVPAVVTNLEDPEELGRIKVKYPGLGADIESNWVRIATPMAGPERGLLYIPEVNDEVLIAFERGDVNYPYMVGGLWNGTDAPPEPNSEAAPAGQVNHRVLKTRAGHVIMLDDTDGEELVSVTTKAGHEVILDDGNEQIVIRDKTGSNEMIIDSSANSIDINLDGDFTVTAKGKITLSSTGDATIDSKAKATIKAATNFEAQGSMGVKVQGLTVDVKADTKATVEGGAMTEIKGTMVKIN